MATREDEWAQVQEFAILMQTKLDASVAKDDRSRAFWRQSNLWWLVSRLLDETAELVEALSRDAKQEALLETADVANFAMMIADVCDKALGDKEE